MPVKEENAAKSLMIFIIRKGIISEFIVDLYSQIWDSEKKIYIPKELRTLRFEVFEVMNSNLLSFDELICQTPW